MKQQKSIILGILVFFFLGMVFSPDALAQREKRKAMKVLEKLNITKDEKDKIEDIRLNAEKENIRTGADVKIKMLELRNLLEKPNTNEKEVDKLVDEIGVLKSKMMKNKVQSVLEIKKVLGPEKSEELRKIIGDGMGEPRMLLKQKMKDKHEGPGFKKKP